MASTLLRTTEVRCRQHAQGLSPPPTPFVMWMTERTGSTWASAMLNSHPNVVALGEVHCGLGSTCQTLSAGKIRAALDGRREHCVAVELKRDGINMLALSQLAQQEAASRALIGGNRSVNSSSRPVPSATRVSVTALGFKLKYLFCGLRPQLIAQLIEQPSERPIPPWPCFGSAQHAAFGGARVICSLRWNAFEQAVSRLLLTHDNANGSLSRCGRANRGRPRSACATGSAAVIL